MKYYNKKPIAARIVQADESIANAQNNPELSEVLASQGYTETELAVGRGLVDAAKAADSLRREQVGAQIVASGTAEKAYRSVRLAVDADRRQFRLALQDEPDYIEALRLAENMGTHRTDFVLQTLHLYQKVKQHPEVMALLAAQNNVTPEYLDNRLNQVISLEEAFRVQQYLIGQTREAQQQRREALQELDVWMKRFIAISRVAFGDDLPKLRKLGITVKSNTGATQEEEVEEKVDAEVNQEGGSDAATDTNEAV